MKKFVALIFVFFSFLFLQTPSSLCDVSALYEGIHTFYTLQNFSSDAVSVVQNGNGFLISCQTSKAKEIKLQLSTNLIQGESFCFYGEFAQVDEVISKLGARVEKSESVGEIVVVYAFSERLGKSLEVGGRQVNLQIAFVDGKITVGSPLILGSF